MTGIFTTACPRNCYSTCGMRVHVEHGRIRRIEPHPDNRATPGGVCLKGLSYYERVSAADRILHPMLRRAPGGDRAAPGDFERISWDEALDLVAGRLETFRNESGPQSVLYYAASGTKGLLNAVGPAFWRLYGGYTTTYGDLCWPAGLEATRLTLGDNRHSAPRDLARARLIVFWGKNPAETNIHQMVFVEEARAAGARVVVIDPRRTETAERADLFLQPRPGTDGALALAVVRLLVESGQVDRTFVDRHVLGFEELAAAADAMTLDRAAGITEIPENGIGELARLVGTVAPMTISPGYGMQRYTNSGQTMRALLSLLAITGNIGKPGAGWVYANLQSHVFDAVRDPVACRPPERPDGVARVSVSTARLGRDMLAQRDPALRMAWIERGNPVSQNPETHRVLEAFRRLDFRVVVEQFYTDTAREADLILPAKTMFEQSDVIGAYWHAYIQLKQKMLEPPGEVRPESAIYHALTRRLGLGGDDLADVMPVTDEDVDRYLRRRLAPFPEITLERLAEGPVLAPGRQDVAFDDLVFPTPSGKIELVSDEAARLWGAPRVPTFAEAKESLPRAAAAGDGRPRFRFHFMTPNTKNRIHSQFNNLRMIRRFGARPYAQVHPDDARARGLRDGGRVRIRNDRGSLEVDVRVDPGIKPGCVAVTNGWWMDEGGAVNVCSEGRETDMGHGAAFHDNLVDIEPAPDGS